MPKIKTFTSPLTIFRTRKQLEELDQEVNRFLVEAGVARVVSVSDTCTTDDSGATIGLLRVLAYE
jgi:hypothetical protein